MILRKFCALAVAVLPAMWAIPAVAQGRGPGAGCGPGGWGSHAISGDPSRTMAGGVSRMGDFGDALTVRQLVDLVAYLQSLYGPSKSKR